MAETAMADAVQLRADLVSLAGDAMTSGAVLLKRAAASLRVRGGLGVSPAALGDHPPDAVVER